MKANVTVLCASHSSHYFNLATDVYDEKRNAMTYCGGLPVVAHPPCRAFGKLSHFSKHDDTDIHLALHCVASVRRNGGVLEHPSHSTLWIHADLPLPGHPRADCFTVPIVQSHFGHRAPKLTWLYVHGINWRDLPALPFELVQAIGRVEMMGKAERERTPLALAQWLIAAALSVPDVASMRQHITHLANHHFGGAA